ncbi:MAG: hypothetical protein R2845_11010 [Thermomicrobiales bacterium]
MGVRNREQVGIRKADRKSGRTVRTTWGFSGESSTVTAIRELINEIETGGKANDR